MARKNANSSETDSASGSTGRGPTRVTDARAMKALSHPVRLALLEVLSLRGPLTATEAGRLIAETPTTCSFHLRQLARWGFVEEAGGGAGRARPWRVTRVGFYLEPAEDDVAGQLASQALASVALSRQVARHEQSMQLQAGYPPAWRGVGSQQQTVWWVTSEELGAVRSELDALVQRHWERLTDPVKRPAGAMPVEFISLTHVFDALVDEALVDQEPERRDGDGQGR
jgi:DNA-binding transcriptional ArsR family regulator